MSLVSFSVVRTKAQAAGWVGARWRRVCALPPCKKNGEKCERPNKSAPAEAASGGGSGGAPCAYAHALACASSPPLWIALRGSACRMVRFNFWSASRARRTPQPDIPASQASCGPHGAYSQALGDFRMPDGGDPPAFSIGLDEEALAGERLAAPTSTQHHHPAVNWAPLPVNRASALLNSLPAVPHPPFAPTVSERFDRRSALPPPVGGSSSAVFRGGLVLAPEPDCALWVRPLLASVVGFLMALMMLLIVTTGLIGVLHADIRSHIVSVAAGTDHMPQEHGSQGAPTYLASRPGGIPPPAPSPRPRWALMLSASTPLPPPSLTGLPPRPPPPKTPARVASAIASTSPQPASRAAVVDGVADTDGGGATDGEAQQDGGAIAKHGTDKLPNPFVRALLWEGLAPALLILIVLAALLRGNPHPDPNPDPSPDPSPDP